MWIDTTDGQQFIQELSKEIVVEVAPEELDLFDELVAEYFRNPAPPDLSARPKDDPLGFGLGEVLIAVTPAAAAMVKEVVNYLMTESMKAAKEESAEVIEKKVKSLFNPKKKDEKPTKKNDKEVRQLNKEQLEQVKKLARRQAIKFGISEDKAEKMANALVGSLALS